MSNVNPSANDHRTEPGMGQIGMLFTQIFEFFLTRIVRGSVLFMISDATYFIIANYGQLSLMNACSGSIALNKPISKHYTPKIGIGEYSTIERV